MANIPLSATHPEMDHSARWQAGLAPYLERARTTSTLKIAGKLTRVVGLTMEAVGCQAAVGDLCHIVSRGGSRVEAEVVGFSGDLVFLMPTGVARGLAPGAQVIPSGRIGDVAVGDALLGRVIDGAGVPLDGGPMPLTECRVPLHGVAQNPLERAPIRESLDVGIRSINALLTVGCGQRLGLFARSGVGKSVLLGMMTRYTEADVIVVGLIGERGREVKEFINDSLGAAGLKRAVVVATPADTPPLLRLHGASRATAIAEYFRDSGRKVLLLMDSVTRFAQAQREIALTIGEPPATRGYPPSVFALLPQLIERAGMSKQGGGSITAIYTVLTDSDDGNDPITDAARAILDGHIVLSRGLAEAGHFPAIDVEASVSRIMPHIVSREELAVVRRFRHFYSLYTKNRDLVSVGAYKPGADPELDRAFALYPRQAAFLQQDMHEQVSMNVARTELTSLLNEIPGAGA